MTHPPLWGALASAYPSLLLVTNGLRILSTVLAAAIVIFWSASVARCVRGRPHEGDAHRAGWVPLAVAVLTFEARWFLPALSDLGRGRMLVVAHGGMALALLSAIYVHGAKLGGLRLRRAIIVHGAMLAACIAVSTVLR